LTVSLATAEQQQMVEEAAVSRRNLAELELMQGHLTQALDQLDHAKTLFAQREDQRGLIDTELLRMQVLIAANALDLAAKSGGVIAPMLTDASDEQRAILALQQAEIARLHNESEAAQKAQADAQRLSAVSGVRALQLQAGLGNPTPSNADADAIVRLGNLPLRILWLEQSMRKQLAEGNANAAAATYRDAMTVLTVHPDAVNAFSLHWLGVQALNKLGDRTGAAAAQAHAADALHSLRSGLSGDLLTSFNAGTDVRAFEGADHGP
jgi:hypothetical protein